MSRIPIEIKGFKFNCDEFTAHKILSFAVTAGELGCVAAILQCKIPMLGLLLSCDYAIPLRLFIKNNPGDYSPDYCKTLLDSYCSVIDKHMSII